LSGFYLLQEGGLEDYHSKVEKPVKLNTAVTSQILMVTITSTVPHLAKNATCVQLDCKMRGLHSKRHRYSVYRRKFRAESLSNRGRIGNIKG